MKKSIVLFIALLLMGSAFLLAGAFDLSNRLDLMKNGLKAEGTVIRLEKHTKRGSVSYRPVIEFTTDTGKSIKSVYSWGSSAKTYSIGQKVNIIYSGKDPENFIIDSYLEFGPIVFIFVGAIIFALDIGIFIKKRKSYLPPAM